MKKPQQQTKTQPEKTAVPKYWLTVSLYTCAALTSYLNTKMYRLN